LLRLAWKGLTGTNTLPYCGKNKIQPYKVYSAGFWLHITLMVTSNYKPSCLGFETRPRTSVNSLNLFVFVTDGGHNKLARFSVATFFRLFHFVRKALPFIYPPEKKLSVANAPAYLVQKFHYGQVCLSSIIVGVLCRRGAYICSYTNTQ
jgi:hypothetical protein